MNFHIADSFTAALTRLTGQEQKQAKTAAFDLQLNPAQPGLQMHRLTNSRDANFWSVRVNGDIRIIVHKTDAGFMLAYVDHHDKAYAWAERRRIEAHPRTGAIQIVEVHERIEEIGPLFTPPTVEPAIETAQPIAPALFAGLSEDALLNAKHELARQVASQGNVHESKRAAQSKDHGHHDRHVLQVGH